LRVSDAAATDDRVHLGAKGGVAFQSDKSAGPVFGVHAAYELSDMFDAELELMQSENRGDGVTSGIFAAAAGLTYKIDILRIVPYVGALGGFYDYMQAPGPHGESGGEFGMALQVGFDFLLTRDIALNLDFRPHFSFHDGITSPYSPLQTIMVGAEYRFGF
jgi:hypothetical protein